MSVFQGSRYTNTKIRAREDGSVVFHIREFPNFSDSKGYYYTVVEGDTIDGIAYRYYENAQLYWAILDANPQIQSEVELKPGMILLIPFYEEVVNHIG